MNSMDRHNETTEMIECYLAGSSLDEVAARFGMTRQGVAWRLKTYRVQLRPPSRPRKKSK